MASIYQEWFSALSPLIAALIIVIGGTFLTLKYQKRKDEKEYRFKLGEGYNALLDEIKDFITIALKQIQISGLDKFKLFDKSFELMLHVSRINFNFNVLLYQIRKEINNPFREIMKRISDISLDSTNLNNNTTPENIRAFFKKLTNLMNLMEEKIAPIIWGNKFK